MEYGEDDGKGGGLGSRNLEFGEEELVGRGRYWYEATCQLAKAFNISTGVFYGLWSK